MRRDTAGLTVAESPKLPSHNQCIAPQLREKMADGENARGVRTFSDGDAVKTDFPAAEHRRQPFGSGDPFPLVGVSGIQRVVER